MINKKSKIYPFLIYFTLLGIMSSPIFGILKFKYITALEYSSVILKVILTVGENVWLIMLPTLLVLFILYLKHTFSKLYSNKENIFWISFFIFGLFLVFLSEYYSNIESQNYSNYLYSTYGLKTMLVNMINTTGYILSVFSGSVLFGLLYLNKEYSYSTNLSKNYKSFLWVLTVVAMIILSFQSIMPFKQWSGLRSYSLQGYEKKFEQFDYVVALKNSTLVSDTIVLPPQGMDWPAVSNLPVVRYFLFPRPLVSSTYFTDQEKTNAFRELKFVLFTTSSGFRNWPVINQANGTISFNYVNTLYYSELTKINSENNIDTYIVKFKK